MSNRSRQRMQAFKAIRKLQKPEGVTNVQWNQVRALLHRLACRLPNVFPSEQTLAEEMHCSVRTVKTYVRLAQDLGLIEVEPDAGWRSRYGITRTNKYHMLICPTRGAEFAPKPTGTYVPVRKDKSPSVNTSCSPQDERRLRRRGQDGEMKSDERRSASEIVAGYPSERIRKKPPVAPPPTRRLVNLFLEEWERTVEQNPSRLRDVRPLDSVGKATGYIRTQFLHPQAGRVWTEAEVEQMIRDFMPAVLRQEAKLKPKQSAWACFTGWWGRGKTTRRDPDAYRKHFEKHR